MTDTNFPRTKDAEDKAQMDTDKNRNIGEKTKGKSAYSRTRHTNRRAGRRKERKGKRFGHRFSQINAEAKKRRLA